MQLSIGQLGLLTAQPWIRQGHFQMIMGSMTTAGRAHHMTEHRHDTCLLHVSVSPPKRELRGACSAAFPSLTIQQMLWSPGDGKSWEHSLMESALHGTQILPILSMATRPFPPGSYPPPKRILIPDSAALISSLILKYVKFFLPCFHVFALVLFFFFFFYLQRVCPNWAWMFSPLESHTKWHVLRDVLRDDKQT